MTLADNIVQGVMRLRPRAVSLCRGSYDVDDLMQQTIVQALTSKGSFQPHTNLGAWLNTIMQRTFLDAARGRKFDRLTCPADDACLLVAHPTALDDIEHATEMRLLSERIDRLPGPQRRAVVCAFRGDSPGRNGAAQRALLKAQAALCGSSISP